MTQQFSLAAKAVLTAVTLTKYDVPPEGLPAFAEEMAPLLAAALRAAADHAPHQVIRQYDWTERKWISCETLVAIAAELEGQ